MQKINHLSLLIKLSIGAVLTALAFIAFFIPAVTHAQTSAFAGAEIVILNQDTPFHYEPGTAPVRFVVDGGTLAEVLYFADPEIRDGQIWRKLRVADGYYGYVRESLISKYTGTIPTIWREINFQPSQVHLNYEARKVNYNIVINQGVDYVTPPEGVTGGSDNTDEDATEEEEEAEEEDTTNEFEGGEIVITSKNAVYYDSPNGNRKFVVAKGTLTEILYFYEPQTINGKVWYKLRVADGNWGYVTTDSIATYTGVVPNIWLEFNYQPTQVHLNYEARKKNPDIVINAGVNYVTSPDEVEEEDDITEEEEIEEDETEEESMDDASTRALLVQLIQLLTQLLNMKLLNM